MTTPNYTTLTVIGGVYTARLSSGAVPEPACGTGVNGRSPSTMDEVLTQSVN